MRQIKISVRTRLFRSKISAILPVKTDKNGAFFRYSLGDSLEVSQLGSLDESGTDKKNNTNMSSVFLMLQRDYAELATDFFFRFFACQSEHFQRYLAKPFSCAHSCFINQLTDLFFWLFFSSCLMGHEVHHMTAVVVVENKHFILACGSFKNRQQGKASGTFPVWSANLPWV